MDDFKTFLKEYNNELQQSPTSENVHPKIVGNYCLEREDVPHQIIDWVLHYLENRKCPYQLAVAIAQNTAKQIDASISEQLLENDVVQEKLLNSFALYTQTLKRVPSVCKSFLEQIDDEIRSPCPLQYAISAFDIKNKRRTMEDRHVIHHNLNLLLDLKDVPAHSYYAVFDGHSGIDAASYASAHLHMNIAKHPQFLTDPSTAIAQSYKTTNEKFLKICCEENVKSGSTAICALIKENTVYLSWVGDSQAVLVKGGKPVYVTPAHKPDRPDERQRIEELGGSITHMGVWRVNGMLAITRALGDFDHRPFISSEPEIDIIELDGSEDFLILACDGLWDGMTPEEVTAALYQNLSENALEEPLDAVAAKLVHKSKEQGSEDNITAIVVFLRDIKTIKDCAIDLLSQASLQNNFHGVNGDHVDSSPCVKPTVLELNSASTKKLKNTANVMSSTGVLYPLFSESGLDVFQNNDSSIFVPQHNIPCFAPEATALSELPTPPIDDVVASQQFGNLCSTELIEGLNNISSEQSCVLEDTNAFNSGVFDSMVNVQSLTPENPVPAESSMNDFTPDEAADVASCVVSNTIETAVKCLSSNELFEPTSPVSTIKLNPYAKPFIPGEFEVTIKPEAVPAQFNVQETIVTESKEHENSSSDYSFKENVAIATEKNFTEDNTSVFNSNNNLKSVQKDERQSSGSMSLLTSEFSELSLQSPIFKDPFSATGTKVEVDSTLVKQDCLLDTISSTEIVNCPTDVSDVLSSVKEAEYSSLSIENPIEPGHAVETSPCTGIDSVSVTEEIKNTFEEIQKTDMDIHGDGIPLSIISNEAELIVHDDQVSKPVEEDSSLDKEIEDLNVKNLAVELTGECVIPKEMCVDEPTSDRECLDKASESVKNIDASFVNTHSSEKSPNDKIQSIELVGVNLVGSLFDGKCEPQIEESNAGIALESIAFDSLNILNTKEELSAAQTVLPSDSADEVPLEAVAVDLQTIPVGVPEAEGVTEDVDSDSEKDGGWSYMKGNIVGSSSKPKAGESEKSKVQKSAIKQDTASKLKKDASKTVQDIKTKVRSLTSTDKTKKPLLEKKTTEIKDKTRSTRTVSSTLPSKTTLPKTNVDKPLKPVSTFARAKKEASTTVSATKVSTTTAIKPSRPTTLRNPTPTTKPVTASNIERSGAAKATNSMKVENVRPKSALSTNGTKAPSRPATLSKTQPSNQSKASTAPAARSTTTRIAASTVPNRALNKPSTLSKPIASESKAKPLVSTIKRAEPKKPDVKETKDNVNKQILARKNVTTSTITKNVTTSTINKNVTTSTVTKSASATSKRITTLSNKLIPSKTRSAPVKTDVNKKDVPKCGMSSLASKANTLLKNSPNAAKSAGNKVAVAKDEAKDPTELASGSEQSSSKVTPTSEEEKFILEVNDKEAAKEKDEVLDQKPTCLQNGISESIKPLEEMVAPASEVECIAQNL